MTNQVKQILSKAAKSNIAKKYVLDSEVLLQAWTTPDGATVIKTKDKNLTHITIHTITKRSRLNNHLSIKKYLNLRSRGEISNEIISSCPFRLV